MTVAGASAIGSSRRSGPSTSQNLQPQTRGVHSNVRRDGVRSPARPTPLVRTVAAGHSRVHRDPRRHHHQRRTSLDQPQLARLNRLALMGRERLHPRVRRDTAPRRPTRGPLRSPATVRHRPLPLRRRLPRGRTFQLARRTHRVSRTPGSRRRSARACRTLDPRGSLRRGLRARQGPRTLGCRCRLGQRRRAHPRRHPDQHIRVAISAVHQRPTGPHPRRALLSAHPRSRANVTDRSIDWAGATLATTGVLSMLYALVRANAAGWGSTQTVGLLILSSSSWPDSSWSSRASPRRSSRSRSSVNATCAQRTW